MQSNKLLAIFSAAIFSSTSVDAQLQISISASKDNTLYESSTGALSNGKGEYFFVGKTGRGEIRRALLAFDVAGNIPAGSVIDSVKLKLFMSRTSTSAGTQEIQLHRVLADWGEGTSNAGANEGTGASATTGDATWIHRFFNTTLWTNAGGDFMTTVSASQSVGNTGFYTWGSTPQMVADVQAWLDAPANNFGWLLMGNEEVSSTAKRFDSRENIAPANRPTLTVFYRLQTKVEQKAQLPLSEFHLYQNYPNPFNPSTTIRFYLSAPIHATLKFYDAMGREVETLVDAKLEAGEHRWQWHASGHHNGIYFYRLQVGEFVESRKLILLR
ncbi:MAG: DNRLRE domain-containing protein [candidate division KSB1 bacterium]|nr:DNRLRE domain-containing protein [candidate division KSB1 bacterium]